jgi:hypothetical protein
LVLLCMAAVLPGADLTMTTGVQITPDKTADAGLYPQQSRPGPSVGIEYGHWFTSHHGVVFGVDYANTDTRLADFTANNWTMNRLGFDAAYEYRWNFRGVSPFAKLGIGSLVTLSGQAPGNVPVGVDWRLEELAGVGVSYRLSRRFGLLAEYECHFFRNPDFSDHAWYPQRNEVSEPKFGITYTFSGRE